MHRNQQNTTEIQKTTENDALGGDAQNVVTPGVDTPGVYGRSVGRSEFYRNQS